MSPKGGLKAVCQRLLAKCTRSSCLMRREKKQEGGEWIPTKVSLSYTRIDCNSFKLYPLFVMVITANNYFITITLACRLREILLLGECG